MGIKHIYVCMTAPFSRFIALAYINLFLFKISFCWNQRCNEFYTATALASHSCSHIQTLYQLNEEEDCVLCYDAKMFLICINTRCVHIH